MQLNSSAARLIIVLKPKIRQYRDKDRDEIRTIAAATASGYPRADLQLVADLLTEYYVNYEPENTLIAETSGDVVGYLSGCVNTGKCRKVKGTIIIPRAITRAIIRGEVGWREIKYLGSFIRVTIRGGIRNNPPPGYPAHFHINVKDGFRGKGIGSELVTSFLDLLSGTGVEGVHVRVRQSDMKTIRFFKSFGFMRKKSYPIVIYGPDGFKTSRSIIYTKRLDSKVKDQ